MAKIPRSKCRLVYLGIKLPEVQVQHITGPPSEIWKFATGRYDRRGYQLEELYFTCLN